MPADPPIDPTPPADPPARPVPPGAAPETVALDNAALALKCWVRAHANGGRRLSETLAHAAILATAEECLRLADELAEVRAGLVATQARVAELAGKDAEVGALRGALAGQAKEIGKLWGMVGAEGDNR
jgi:hypothetical protein